MEFCCSNRITTNTYKPYIALAAVSVIALVIGLLGLLGILNVNPFDTMGKGSYYLMGAAGIVLLALTGLAIKGCKKDTISEVKVEITGDDLKTPLMPSQV